MSQMRLKGSEDGCLPHPLVETGVCQFCMGPKGDSKGDRYRDTEYQSLYKPQGHGEMNFLTYQDSIQRYYIKFV